MPTLNIVILIIAVGKTTDSVFVHKKDGLNIKLDTSVHKSHLCNVNYVLHIIV